MKKSKLHIAFFGIIITLLLSSCIRCNEETEMLINELNHIPGFNADSIASFTTTEDGRTIIVDAQGNVATSDAQGNLSILFQDGATLSRDNSIREESYVAPTRWTNSVWSAEPDIEEDLEISAPTYANPTYSGTSFVAQREILPDGAYELEFFHTSARFTSGRNTEYFNYSLVNSKTVLLENNSRKITGELKSYGRAAELELLDFNGRKIAELYVTKADSIEALYGGSK